MSTAPGEPTTTPDETFAAGERKARFALIRKILRWTVVIVVLLVATPLIAALFIDREFTIEKEVVIDKPTDVVFDYIKHLKNQDQYSKWFMLDPKMRQEYRGEDGKRGFVVAWESTNPSVGKGEVEIKRIVDGERVEVEIRIRDPFQSTDPAYTMTQSVGEGKTKVTHGYHGKLPYPMNLMCPFICESLAQDIQGNLNKLKEVLEK